MTRRSTIGFLFLLLAALAFAPGVLRAHEGHDHKIMGTIKSLETAQLAVLTTDEKTHRQTPVTIALTAKTKYLRGTTVVGRSALVIGERVVVSVGDGKPPLKASEVRVGAVRPSAPQD